MCRLLCLDFYEWLCNKIQFNIELLFQLHALLWKLCWLASLSRDVTGKAPLSSEVVELVILWCYGFGTVLDFFGWFRCESPAGRLPGQPCARWSAPLRVQEHQRVAREEEKREGASLARRFKQSVFLDIPKGGWSNQSVGTGRSPAFTAALARHFSCDEK